MRAILFLLSLAALATGCVTSDAFRIVQLDSSLFHALCGNENVESRIPPVALAAGVNSPIAGASVSCTSSHHPSAISDRRRVALEIAASAAGLARPAALILVAERPRKGRLSAELVDAIKIQAASIGMARVVMLDKTVLSDQRIYVGYAYP